MGVGHILDGSPVSRRHCGESPLWLKGDNNMKKLLTCTAAAISLVFALPASLAAQDQPLRPAEYVDVSAIQIDDGHRSDYANHLASMWRT